METQRLPAAAGRALLLLALVVASCSRTVRGPVGERIDLALGFEPSFEARPGAGDRAHRGPGAEHPEPLWSAGSGEGWVVVEHLLRPEQWEGFGGVLWRAPRPLPGVGRSAARSGPAAEVSMDGHPIPPLPGRAWGHPFSRLEQDGLIPELEVALAQTSAGRASFVHGDHVYLYDPSGERPRPSAVRDPISLGERENGTWMVSIDSIRARGIPVLSGTTLDVPCALPANARLSFVLVCVGAAPGGGEQRRARVSVALDGAPIFERELEPGPRPRPERITLELPAAARAQATLSFALSGTTSLAAFLVPTLEPATPLEGAASGRGARPDIVLFLADTYRADNLALHGGDARIAPHANRFAAESLAFTQARSPSSWTFPSHAAMFSGLYPFQSGASARDRTLPPEAHTIAERLSEEGYRTLAITEGGYVSPTFGLAQGFEWFETVRPRDGITIEVALERLDLDGGRPIFLFVQSYRAHGPYVVGDGVRERLGIEHEIPETRDFEEPSTRGSEDWAVRRRAEYLAGYRGASAELDLLFGALRAGLEERGRFDDSYVVFTSDHGEAFFEHGIHGHGNGVWEEHVHIPLLLRGPGIVPGRSELPVGLVDLPRTLAAIAGVEPDRAWLGADLRTLDRPRPSFVFQCTQAGPPDRMALIVGARKVLLAAELDAAEARHVDFAYDLGSDPHERTDLAHESWPARLLVDHRRAFRALFRPRLVAGEAELTSELEAGLRALGYLGD